MKELWNTLVDIKDELMVRVYAFFRIKDYRYKAIRAIIIFAAAFTVVCEISIIATGGKLSLFAFLAVIVILTTALCAVIDWIKEINNDKK